MTTPPIHRRTLASPATLQGVGLFTARPVNLTIHPARPGAGLRFQLAHEEALAHIASLSTDPIHPAFASLPPRCTCLALPSGQIGTVEHLLSALTGLGVTDALLTLDAPEVPILDGSALPFVRAILDAGLSTLEQTLKPLTPPRPFRIEGDDASAFIEILPDPTPSYRYDLDYGDASPIPRSSASWSSDPDEYATSVAPARTFCLEREATAMRQLGLFAHLTPADMLVIGPRGPIDNTLRFPDEPARHKLLDLIGDLALVGRPIAARIHAVRSGHALNHAAARALLDSVK
ncbi:MAG: UDP-3-O-acyl-N-acetylglucosamine deacetylase [Phycisphaerales bacterium JB059]